MKNPTDLFIVRRPARHTDGLVTTFRCERVAFDVFAISMAEGPGLHTNAVGDHFSMAEAKAIRDGLTKLLRSPR